MTMSDTPDTEKGPAPGPDILDLNRPHLRGDHKTDDTDPDHENDSDYDGYRPSRVEMRARSHTNTMTRASKRDLGVRPGSISTISTSHSNASTTTSSITNPPTSTLARTISRIRSRPSAGYQFAHPLSHVPTSRETLVDFDGPKDPYRPMNWPMHKKVITTLLYGLVTMTATWASSCYSAGTTQISSEFHVGAQVATLGTSLYLVGFGVGPLLWAPLSEVYGRRIAVFAPMFVAICFSFGSATAKDFQTLMLTRFWGAFFASAPVTNTGGVLGDLFGPAERGVAMAGYAMAVVGGPVIGM